MNNLTKSLSTFFTTPLFYILLPVEFLLVYFFLSVKAKNKLKWLCLFLLSVVILFQIYVIYLDAKYMARSN